jgi:hypothetical protein
MAVRHLQKQATSAVVSAAIDPAKTYPVVARRIVTGPVIVAAETAIAIGTVSVSVSVIAIAIVVTEIASKIVTMAETETEDAIEQETVNETASAPAVTDPSLMLPSLVHKPGV